MAGLLVATGAVSAQSDRMTFAIKSNGGNCTGCEWVQADGEIAMDSDLDLEKFIAAELHPSPGQDKFAYLAIRMNSPGGSFIGGIRLGRMIRLRGFSTEVGGTVLDGDPADEYHTDMESPGTCQSACAIAFLGGAGREAKEGSLGVHQFYSKDELVDPSAKIFNGVDLSVQQLLSSALLDYVSEMGVDAGFVSLASKTLPGSMRFLSLDELERLRVNFRPDEFGPWEVKNIGRGAVAISKSGDGKKIAQVFCHGDGTPQLIITPGSVDERWIQKAMNVPQAVEALGLKIRRDSRNVFVSKEVLYMHFMLPGFDPRRLRKDDMEIGFGGDVSMSIARGFDWSLPMANAVSTMTLALKNCI
jgi:hypothetical protein